MVRWKEYWYGCKDTRISIPAQLDDLGTSFHFPRPVAPHLKVAVILPDLRLAWRAEQHCNYWPQFVPQASRWLRPAWNARPVRRSQDLAPMPQIRLLMPDMVSMQEETVPSCTHPHSLGETRDNWNRPQSLEQGHWLLLRWSPLTSPAPHFCTPIVLCDTEYPEHCQSVKLYQGRC